MQSLRTTTGQRPCITVYIRCRSSPHVSIAVSRSFVQSSRRYARPKLPDTPARTRFAPSPTGNLHLGSIRTALFNYLLAKRTGGQFLLRIEDTDQKRTIPGAEPRLFQDLRWAGLQWDEGPEVGGPRGPYRQSERLSLYNTYIKELLNNDSAYRCFCSGDRIDKLNRLRHEKGLPLGYDRKCADMRVEQAEERAAKGESHVIRFRVPEQYPNYTDLVFGKSGHGARKNLKNLADEPVFDDPVLIKSDTFPTYHFANVVDDKLMQVTHVIRGSEWMSSTPLHVALYNAFEWTAPVYGHVPLLVDSKGQKLSKRNFDSDIANFRDQGIFPEALTNFAALLGWSHQQKSDVMDLKRLEEVFNLKITKGNTIVAFEKLNYLQEQHAWRRRQGQQGQAQLDATIDEVSKTITKKYGHTLEDFLRGRDLKTVVARLLKVKSIAYRNSAQFVDDLELFFTRDILQKRPELSNVVPEADLLPDVRIMVSTLSMIPETHWTEEHVHSHLDQLDFTPSKGDENPALLRRRMWRFLRWAVLGGVPGPDMSQSLIILGREASLQRIEAATLLAREAETMQTRPKVDVTIDPAKKGDWQAHKLPVTGTNFVQQ